MVRAVSEQEFLMSRVGNDLVVGMNDGILSRDVMDKHVVLIEAHASLVSIHAPRLLDEVVDLPIDDVGLIEFFLRPLQVLWSHFGRHRLPQGRVVNGVRAEVDVLILSGDSDRGGGRPMPRGGFHGLESDAGIRVDIRILILGIKAFVVERIVAFGLDPAVRLKVSEDHPGPIRLRVYHDLGPPGGNDLSPFIDDAPDRPFLPFQPCFDDAIPGCRAEYDRFDKSGKRHFDDHLGIQG